MISMFCVAEVAIIRHMSRQVSLGSAGDYKADEQAGVTRLSWRLSLVRELRSHVPGSN